MQPLVTVIIPTYNRAVTIKRAINSVLHQTYKELELIIVDDGSTDDTVEIVHSYQDKRIKLVCLSENCGANIARNAGIKLAKGEYIAFQDSDDEWLEDKLEIQINYMQQTDKKICYCPYILYEDTVKTIIPDPSENKEQYGEKLKETLRTGNVVPAPALVIHKQVIEIAGMFDETMRRLQDYEYAIRLCQCSEIAYIDRPLLNAYRLNNCISNDIEALLEAFRQIFVKHINFIDIDVILIYYLHYCKIYDTEGVYSKDLGEMLNAVKTKVDAEKGKRCVEIIEFMLQWYQFLDKKIYNNDFVLYGAGIHGKNALKALKSVGAIPKCFWVTHKQQEEEIDGIPIVELPAHSDQQLSVIVSVGNKMQEELINNLDSRGIKEYFVYPPSKYSGIVGGSWGV